MQETTDGVSEDPVVLYALTPSVVPAHSPRGPLRTHPVCGPLRAHLYAFTQSVALCALTTSVVLCALARGPLHAHPVCSSARSPRDPLRAHAVYGSLRVQPVHIFPALTFCTYSRL